MGKWTFCGSGALICATALIGLTGCGGSHAGEQGVVVIGRGTTAAGEAFVATAYRGERPPPVSSRRHAVAGVQWHTSGCTASVQIGEPEAGSSSSGGSTTCLDHLSSAPEPSVTCNGGLLAITSHTTKRTRRVRLTLSNGAQLTSAALLVPARIANAPGLYYQVMRGPSPIPVSLTELDSQGRTVRVVRLPAITECTKEPLKYLPGGIHILATDRVADGPRFSITGERYRFLGKIYFDLAAEIDSHGERGGGGGGSFSPQSPKRLFAWSTQEGCHAHPYVQWVIIYGLLRNPRDRVFARVAKRAYRLKTVSIPASLHAGGALAYAVMPRRPTDVLVLTPSGTTASAEKLEPPGSEQCEPGESSGISMVG